MKIKKIIIVVIRQMNNTSFFFVFFSATIFSYRSHKHYFEKYFRIFRESFYVSAATFPSYVQQTLRIARLTKWRFSKLGEIDTGPTVRSLGIRPTSLVTRSTRVQRRRGFHNHDTKAGRRDTPPVTLSGVPMSARTSRAKIAANSAYRLSGR